MLEEAIRQFHRILSENPFLLNIFIYKLHFLKKFSFVHLLQNSPKNLCSIVRIWFCYKTAINRIIVEYGIIIRTHITVPCSYYISMSGTIAKIICV